MATPPRKIQLVRLAHVYYKYSDLEQARQFLLDFGFSETKRLGEGEGSGAVTKIYFRGYGTEPWVFCATRSNDGPAFGGAAFVVESEQDLRLASDTLPGASTVYDLKDAPGGGRGVTFFDPVDGFPMHLVHGQTEVDMLDISLPHTPMNYVSCQLPPCTYSFAISLVLFERVFNAWLASDRAFDSIPILRTG